MKFGYQGAYLIEEVGRTLRTTNRVIFALLGGNKTAPSLLAGRATLRIAPWAMSVTA